MWIKAEGERLYNINESLCIHLTFYAPYQIKIVWGYGEEGEDIDTLFTCKTLKEARVALAAIENGITGGAQLVDLDALRGKES